MGSTTARRVDNNPTKALLPIESALLQTGGKHDSLMNHEIAASCDGRTGTEDQLMIDFATIEMLLARQCPGLRLLSAS